MQDETDDGMEEEKRDVLYTVALFSGCVPLYHTTPCTNPPIRLILQDRFYRWHHDMEMDGWMALQGCRLCVVWHFYFYLCFVAGYTRVCFGGCDLPDVSIVHSISSQLFAVHHK